MTDALPGQFAIVTVYDDDGDIYLATCLRCDWTSERAATRSALVKSDGPVIQHQRDKHRRRLGNLWLRGEVRSRVRESP